MRTTVCFRLFVVNNMHDRFTILVICSDMSEVFVFISRMINITIASFLFVQIKPVVVITLFICFTSVLLKILF